METVRPEQVDVVIVTAGSANSDSVSGILRKAGFRCHVMAVGLGALSRVAEIKPSAIVMLGIEPAAQEWILNFADGSHNAPAIIAVGPADLLPEAPDWLYDVVPEGEVATALEHRLKLAVTFQDMRRLAEVRVEEFGKSSTQIRLVSMIDVVTGLFNRRYYRKHLRESYAAARRYNRPLTCLVVRIDTLAGLVAQTGTEATNDVLDSVALAITTVIRESDIAARIDDDLFGFLLPETTREGAEGLVQRLLARLKTAKYPHRAIVEVSSAHVELDDSHADGEALLEAALTALPGPKTAAP